MTDLEQPAAELREAARATGAGAEGIPRPLLVKGSEHAYPAERAVEMTEAAN